MLLVPCCCRCYPVWSILLFLKVLLIKEVITLLFAVGSVGKGAETFGTLVSLGTTIAVSLAFFFFFWNLFKFIKAADPESKESAQGKMVWSLVAIIVIVSLWGIIAFVRGVLGIDAGLDDVNDVPVPGTVLNPSRVGQ